MIGLKKIFLLYLLFLICPLTAEQSNSVDSLRTLLKDAEGIQLINILNEIAYEMRRSSYDSTISFSNRALLLSDSLDYSVGYADAMINKGIGYYYAADLDSALAYFLKAHSICDSLEYELGKAKASNYIGNLYNNLGNNSDALNAHLEALEIRRNFGTKKEVAYSLVNIGNVLKAMRKYDDAYTNYDEAYSILRSIDDKRGIAAVLNNIGFCYFDERKFDEAYEYYLRALDIYEEIGDKIGIANNLQNIALYHTRKLQPQQAIDAYMKSLTVADEISSRALKRNGFKGLSDTYLYLHDYRSAYKYYRNYIIQRDSINSEETKARIAEMRSRFEIVQNQKELELLKRESQIQSLELQKERRLSSMLLIVIILILLILGFIVFLFRYKQQINKSLTEKNLAIEQTRKELEKARENAEKANLAKTDFLAKMSHDLRTPLNSIIGYTRLLKNSNSFKESEKNDLKTIEQSGNHLLELIDDILSLSKIEAGQLTLKEEIFNLPQMLQDIAAMIRIKSDQKGLDFALILDEGIPKFITLDAKRLRQVLLNLLGNAVKFTEEGKITLSVRKSNTQTIFQVSDTGPGIHPDRFEEIFSPFKQLETNKVHQSGTGLGLAICRNIVRYFGSDITVASEIGKGTTFTFKLELKEEKSFAVNTESLDDYTIKGYEGEPKTILVVDDNKINVSYLSRFLKQAQFEILEAFSAEEALSMCEDKTPDLMIIDILLPGKDGFILVQELRKQEKFKETPIIAISASVFDSMKKRALNSGFNTFIPKPINLSELFQTIGSFLGLVYIKEPDLDAQPEGQNEDECTAPPKDAFANFYDAIAHGNINEIERIADLITNEHTSYKQFCKKILEYARSFQINEMQMFVDKCFKENVMK